MKALTTTELNHVSGGAFYHHAGEALIEGAVIGGFFGLLLSVANGSANPVSTIATWALAGGVVNAIIRD